MDLQNILSFFLTTGTVLVSLLGFLAIILIFIFCAAWLIRLFYTQINAAFPNFDTFYRELSESLIFVLFILMIIGFSVGFCFTIFNSDQPKWIPFTTFVVVITLIFPGSYFAYSISRSKIIKKTLQSDFNLLGLLQENLLPGNNIEFEDIFKKAYSRNQYLIWISLISFISVIMFGIFLNSSGIPNAKVIKIVFFGFMGGLVYSVIFINKRDITSDLQPQVYASIARHLLFSVFITFVGAYIFQPLIDKESPNESPSISETSKEKDKINPSVEASKGVLVESVRQNRNDTVITINPIAFKIDKSRVSLKLVENKPNQTLVTISSILSTQNPTKNIQVPEREKIKVNKNKNKIEIILPSQQSENVIQPLKEKVLVKSVKYNYNSPQETLITIEISSPNNQDSVDSEVSWQILLVAFIFGFSPDLGLRWLIANRIINLPIDQYNEQPLKKIPGLNTWDEVRLQELGIDNVEKLANADLGELILNTRYSTQQIIEWVDQAILHMKVGASLERYSAINIKTYHALQEKLELFQPPNPNTVHPYISAALGISDYEEIMFLVNYEDYPNYAHIRNYYDRYRTVVDQAATDGQEQVTRRIAGGRVNTSSP